MKTFLSSASVHQLWTHKLQSMAPRLATESGNPAALLQGDLLHDLGLDSLERYELAAHFHGMFHMMEQANPQYLLQYHRAEEWIDSILQAANDWAKPISFYSSGSQGKPKICTHHKMLLLQEIKAWNNLFRPQGKIWRFVPPQHIYGFLFGILLPDHTGLPLEDGIQNAFANVRKKWKREDWIIGFPDLYSSWLRSRESFPKGITLISSTSPLADNIFDDGKDLGISVIDIFGSSETAGVGYRRLPDVSYQLLPYWNRTSEGLIRMNPASGLKVVADLQDHMQWTRSGKFNLKGRKDKAIQIGGQNVYPREIAHKIKTQIEGVEQCWIRPMHIGEGNRLKCWIQTLLPKSEWTDLEKACYHWIERHLSVPERPKHILIQHKAPQDKMGKEQDWRIPDFHI